MYSAPGSSKRRNNFEDTRNPKVPRILQRPSSSQKPANAPTARRSRPREVPLATITLRATIDKVYSALQPDGGDDYYEESNDTDEAFTRSDDFDCEERYSATSSLEKHKQGFEWNMEDGEGKDVEEEEMDGRREANERDRGRQPISSNGDNLQNQDLNGHPVDRISRIRSADNGSTRPGWGVSLRDVWNTFSEARSDGDLESPATTDFMTMFPNITTSNGIDLAQLQSDLENDVDIRALFFALNICINVWKKKADDDRKSLEDKIKRQRGTISELTNQALQGANAATAIFNLEWVAKIGRVEVRYTPSSRPIDLVLEALSFNQNHPSPDKRGQRFLVYLLRKVIPEEDLPSFAVSSDHAKYRTLPEHVETAITRVFYAAHGLRVTDSVVEAIAGAGAGEGALGRYTQLQQFCKDKLENFFCNARQKVRKTIGRVRESDAGSAEADFYAYEPKRDPSSQASAFSSS